MFNLIRAYVSENRKRYIKDNVNLDLSFISDRIIAMAYPSDGVEGVYRNSYNQVKNFLDANYGHHYKVYNLRIEKLYDDSKFEHMANYPFYDHQAPPFESLIAFCEDASGWLNENPKNVVVVHCKAGKGRTGTVIAALLIYTGDAKNANEAIEMYGKMRTHDMKGVTIPSQIRYIHYFDHMMNYSDIYQTQKQRILSLTHVIIHTIPYQLKQTSPILEVLNNDTCVSDSVKDQFEQNRLSDTIEIRTLGLIHAQGDLKFSVFYLIKNNKDNKKLLFSFWLNTAFFSMDSGSCIIVLKKSEIDLAFRDKECKYFDQDFSVELRFKI